jgi:Flp pilus assembly protein TadD
MNQAVQKQLLKYLICALLAVVTFAAFASVGNNDFIAFDDRQYIVDNVNLQHGFSGAAIKWAFTAFYSSNWHPLTWLSHTLDYSLYGLDPSGHHLTNLAFHIANVILLFLLLQNLTAKIWSATFVALLFAIHPMHVESVAWASERKDVLSTFFFLLTLLAYARYTKLVAAKKRSSWFVYGLTLVLFALGLMAKPMLVTLPGILFLLDFWPLQRFQFPLKNQPKSLLCLLLIEKIPFILLTVLSCYVTFLCQKTTGAVKLEELYPFVQRFDHVPVSYAWYILKLFWPTNLSVYYPLQYQIPDLEEFLGLLLLAAATLFALLGLHKCPWFFVGWFWFLGMLVPVIGLVQVGNQDYADRYTYLPYIGLFIMIAWGVSSLLEKFPYHKYILWAAAMLVAVACFWRTFVEVQYWKNGQTLFNRALARNPNDEMVWMLLGLEYETHGNNDKAMECMSRATTINDQFNLAWHNLGHTYAVKRDYPAAINAYQMSLSCTWLKGDKISLYSDIGDAFMASGQYASAIPNYQNSLDLSPDQPLILNNLGQCYLHNQRIDQALAAFQQAISLNPDYSEAQLNLAMLLGSTGHDSDAITHYRKVIELDTNMVLALNNLAWLLATDPNPQLRNGKEAVPLAEHACERAKYQEAFLIGTLAAAYAEAGCFDDAATAAQKAHDVALAHGQKEIADRNLKLMQLYKSGKPFHMETNVPTQKPSS